MPANSPKRGRLGRRGSGGGMPSRPSVGSPAPPKNLEGGARAYDLVQSHHALRACVSRGSVQKKLEFQPKGTANLQFQSFGERLPRRVAPRQAREARQSPILQRYATLRVAKRKRLDFGFGSSFWRSQNKTKFCNQSFFCFAFGETWKR